MKPYYTRVLIEDEYGNALVVVHRDKKIALPGGKIEQGEESYDAAIREVLEETGIRIKEMIKVHEGVYKFSSGAHMGVFYRAVSWSGSPANKEPHKLAFVGWVSQDFLLATQSDRVTDILKAARG